MKKKKSYKIINLMAVILLIYNITFAHEAENNPLDTLSTSVKNLQDDLSKLKKIKVSGYMQPQFQYCDSNGVKSYAGGDFPVNADKRFSLRRARVKIGYQGNLTEYVFQIDATEKGVVIKDMYAKVTEPLFKVFSMTIGCQNRPFGFEIGYSSSMRESPERGRMSQIIFPGERDLGAMLTFQPPKSSVFNFIKLEGGFFNGTGSSAVDFDKMKDFIGHLSINKTTKNEKFNIGAGLSYYSGGWRQGNKYVWSDGIVKAGIPGFVCDSASANTGIYTKRQYVGGDFQFNCDMPFGFSILRAEYIQGTQPAGNSSTASPSAQNDSKTSKPFDTYVRKFNGAYFYFIQNILKTKHQLIFKYDWYDPNTNVSLAEIDNDVNGTKTKLSAADIKYNTIGIGWAYKCDQNVKFIVYYDIVKNENALIKGYTKDVTDNVLTIRMLYKF